MYVKLKGSQILFILGPQFCTKIVVPSLKRNIFFEDANVTTEVFYSTKTRN